jgi:hypothetical protein
LTTAISSLPLTPRHPPPLLPLRPPGRLKRGLAAGHRSPAPHQTHLESEERERALHRLGQRTLRNIAAFGPKLTREAVGNSTAKPHTLRRTAFRPHKSAAVPVETSKHQSAGTHPKVAQGTRSFAATQVREATPRHLPAVCSNALALPNRKRRRLHHNPTRAFSSVSVRLPTIQYGVSTRSLQSTNTRVFKRASPRRRLPAAGRR